MFRRQTKRSSLLANSSGVSSMVSSQRVPGITSNCYLVSTPWKTTHESSFTSRLRTAAILGGTAVSVGLLFKPFLEPRESPVRTPAIDLTVEESYAIVNATEFRSKHFTKHGSLHPTVVKHIHSGNHYVKKGAHSRETLIKEFVIANMFAIVEPELQPESLLMQQSEGDTAQFFTLSRKYPDSMDLEEFIRQPDYQDKLKKKKLLGLDTALAKDLMLAKQQDMKFQNLIVIEFEEVYYVCTIDHELAGESFYRSLSRTRFSLDIDEMILSLRDLHNPDNTDLPVKEKIGLMNDPRAKEFINTIRQDMHEINILNYYEKFANTDFQPLFDMLEVISKEDSVLVTKKDCDKYKKWITGLQSKAKQFVSENEFFYRKEEPRLRMGQ